MTCQSKADVSSKLMVIAFIYTYMYQDCTDGVISLTGGKRRNEGRVEICINGIWGTVCDKFFDQQDAEVLCNQLGHSNLGLYFTYSLYLL